MNTESLVQKIWSFCATLRDDGIGYGDYVEQLTHLLFLKLADEYSRPPHKRRISVPQECRWGTLVGKRGEALQAHYMTALHQLGALPGLLGAIFEKAHNKIQDPRKLARLIHLIDAETWSAINSDIKGDLYEGLLQRSAEDARSGAGQYFTPRPVIQAVIECVRPEPLKTIADPACGTGGFFLGAYAWLNRPGVRLTKAEDAFLRRKTFFGNEIVPSTRRLCLMNLFLHGIGEFDQEPTISGSDALSEHPGSNYDYVFANPPFGRRSSVTITTDNAEPNRDALTYERSDFWETTSNKQLNFLQHIVSIMKPGGKAAVVIPDNVLFEAGAGERIRRRLLETRDLHTVLRLPSGIFYAQGVKANVLFFDRPVRSPRVATNGVWIYDLRTNTHFTRRAKPLTLQDLQDFLRCYAPQNRKQRRQSERFRFFPYEDLIIRDKASLDISWLEDDTGNGVDAAAMPSILQQEIVEHLEAALAAFRELGATLPEVTQDEQ